MDGLKFETTTSEQGSPTISEQRPSIRPNGSTSGWTEGRIEKLKFLVTQQLSARDIEHGLLL
jgi:hypothetical protein